MLRGIDTLTATLLLTELDDFRRFRSLRALAYVGLVPGDDSSGEKHRRLPTCGTGDALVRRLIVETSWHYRHRPSAGAHAPTPRTTERRDCDSGHAVAATVSSPPATRELAGYL